MKLKGSYVVDGDLYLVNGELCDKAILVPKEAQELRNCSKSPGILPGFCICCERGRSPLIFILLYSDKLLYVRILKGSKFD